MKVLAYKKTILTLIFSLFYVTSFSQDSKDITVKEIKEFIKHYAVNLITKKTGRNSVIYFNKVEKIIDIDGYQISLQDVKTTYYFSESMNHCVSFDCKGVDCILQPNGSDARGFAIPFLSKKNCYDFIDLINQLKK